MPATADPERAIRDIQSQVDDLQGWIDRNGSTMQGFMDESAKRIEKNEKAVADAAKTLADAIKKHSDATAKQFAALEKRVAAIEKDLKKRK